MFFKNFPGVGYKFGDETFSTSITDLSMYTDVVDSIKDSLDFYQYHTVQDQRPDQLSYQLYGDHQYYWTFFLMNDHLRRQGWPLGRREVEAASQKVFHNTTITTRNTITEGFNVGDTVVGITSTAQGVVSRRNLDLGQIIIKGTVNFSAGEIIKCQTTLQELIVYSSVPEYNSVKNYIDGDGEPVDIDPTVGPGALLTPVTYVDYYKEENEKLKLIRVIKPEAIGSVVAAFNEAIQAG